MAIIENLQILQSVADKLIGGQLHSGNVAHDAPTKGYTIQNCVNNIKRYLEEYNKYIKMSVYRNRPVVRFNAKFEDFEQVFL